MSFIQDAKEALERPEYREDSIRIKRVAWDHGVDLTINQAEKAWLAYSDSMAAGWMGLPEDDIELWNIIS